MSLNVNTSLDLNVASSDSRSSRASSPAHMLMDEYSLLRFKDEDTVPARLLLNTGDPEAQGKARARRALAKFDEGWSGFRRVDSTSTSSQHESTSNISTFRRSRSILTEPPIVEPTNASNIPQITKSELERALNHQFTAWLGEQTDAKERAGGGTQDVDRSDQQQPTNGTNRLGGKRKGKEKVSSTQDNQEDDDRDDDDISSSGRGKRPRYAEDSQVNGQKLFACPFGKTYPQSFSCCVERGFKDASRVKEHIYRRHLKFQCIRCGEVFGKIEHLKVHQRSSQACENINPKPPSDAINQEQKEKIRSREGLKGMSEPEKWIRIYKIIYPDAKTPFPSPYLELVSRTPTLEGFMGFAHQELPSLITTEVDTLPIQTIILDVHGRRVIHQMLERILHNLRNNFEQFPPSSLANPPLPQNQPVEPEIPEHLEEPEQPEQPEQLQAVADVAGDFNFNDGHGFNAANEVVYDFLQDYDFNVLFSSSLEAERQEAYADIEGGLQDLDVATDAPKTPPDSGYDSSAHLGPNDGSKTN